MVQPVLDKQWEDKIRNDNISDGIGDMSLKEAAVLFVKNLEMRLVGIGYRVACRRIVLQIIRRNTKESCSEEIKLQKIRRF